MGTLLGPRYYAKAGEPSRHRRAGAHGDDAGQGGCDDLRRAAERRDQRAAVGVGAGASVAVPSVPSLILASTSRSVARRIGFFTTRSTPSGFSPAAFMRSPKPVRSTTGVVGEASFTIAAS